MGGRFTARNQNHGKGVRLVVGFSVSWRFGVLEKRKISSCTLALVDESNVQGNELTESLVLLKACRSA